jgi:hypothetical protein
MEYIKICEDTENAPFGALFTLKEVEKIKAHFKKTRNGDDYDLLLDIKRYGVKVKVSKKDIGFFWGFRMEFKG